MALNSTSASGCCAARLARPGSTISRVMTRTSSAVFLIWYLRWIGLVEMNVWMRGASAPLTASQQTRTSLLDGARQSGDARAATSRAISATESKSPLEAIGKPASMTSTPMRASCWAISSFSVSFMRRARRLFAVAQRGVEDLHVARAGGGAGGRLVAAGSPVMVGSVTSLTPPRVQADATGATRPGCLLCMREKRVAERPQVLGIPPRGEEEQRGESEAAGPAHEWGPPEGVRLSPCDAWSGDCMPGARGAAQANERSAAGGGCGDGERPRRFRTRRPGKALRMASRPLSPRTHEEVTRWRSSRRSLPTRR